MQEVSIDKIKAKAQEFASGGQNWHFHILTPECQLNDTDSYALILENTTDGESWVSYSDKPYMDIGKQLVKLLHGDDVVKENGEQKLQAPSEQVGKLLKRAKEMNNTNKFWHHHMLFPGCQFNKSKNKFIIMFEDQENNQVIESVSDEEPKYDLQHIEGLFYSQKKENK